MISTLYLEFYVLWTHTHSSRRTRHRLLWTLEPHVSATLRWMCYIHYHTQLLPNSNNSVHYSLDALIWILGRNFLQINVMSWWEFGGGLSRKEQLKFNWTRWVQPGCILHKQHNLEDTVCAWQCHRHFFRDGLALLFLLLTWGCDKYENLDELGITWWWLSCFLDRFVLLYFMWWAGQCNAACNKEIDSTW